MPSASRRHNSLASPRPPPRYDPDDHAWVSIHWKSASQKGKADMGDPMASDAEMTEAITGTAEKMRNQAPTNADKTAQAFPAHSTEDLSIEVIINLA